MALILVFLLQLVPGFTDLFIFKSAVPYEFWRFVSSLFLHEGLGHLLSNLLALALFGSLLEGVIGGNRFLSVFFISGIVANIVSLPFYASTLGASGAIYGVIGTLLILRPTLMVWAVGVPMPLFLAGFFWVGADVAGFFSTDNIGHAAHLGGLVIGLVMGSFWRKKYAVPQTKKKVILDESMVRSWEERYLLR